MKTSQLADFIHVICKYLVEDLFFEHYPISVFCWFKSIQFRFSLDFIFTVQLEVLIISETNFVDSIAKIYYYQG